MKLSKLLMVAILSTLIGCAGLSEALNNNELISRIAIKDTVIVALDKSSNQKDAAVKVTSAANKVIDLLEGSGGISKKLIIDTFRKNLGSDLSLGMRIVVDDLILILDEIYKPELPTTDLPEQYKADSRKVMEYLKEGARLYL